MIEDRFIIMAALCSLRDDYEGDLDACIGIEDEIARSQRRGLARLNAEIARRAWQTIGNCAADRGHSRIEPWSL